MVVGGEQGQTMGRTIDRDEHPHEITTISQIHFVSLSQTHAYTVAACLAILAYLLSAKLAP